MAYDFTAASSRYLSTTAAPVLQNPLTIACWFRMANTTSVNALVNLNTGTGGSTERYVLFADGTVTGDIVRLSVIGTGTSANTDTTTGFSANTWHHACAVVESNSSRTVYLDAGSSATTTQTISVSNIANVRIGSRESAGSQGLFATGQIAEVGIWNAALTAAEVASLADGMTCDKVRPQSLVFYAPLVRNLQDVRGGLTITNNNTATVANHPRVYA
jgi:hypothetical protein